VTTGTRPGLLVATTNIGKLREIGELLGHVDIELLTLSDVPPVSAPEETGATFEENARLKATYYSTHAGRVTVAEDSGLVIDALGGAPGVLSARYLRPDASYAERFDEIFRLLRERPEAGRSARFVCALAVADGNAVVFETTQTVEGVIAEAPRGTAGFGYDPIFLFPAYQRTLAEVTRDEKLAVAHRGKAFRELARWLSAVNANTPAVPPRTDV
jgi:XTP/dITP diphosphohydrolase